MPTIKDIAQRAGVSHGTVSNVLNGRGNVSVEKIRLVEDAARALGYRLNATAHSLRQGSVRAVAVILPGTAFPQYGALYTVLEQELRLAGYAVQLYPTHASPIVEQKAIADALASRVSLIVAVSCLPDAAVQYSFGPDGPSIVFVDNCPTPLPPQSVSAGFDYGAAGAEIGRYLVERGATQVALFSPSNAQTHIREFTQRLDTVLGTAGVSLRRTTCPDSLVNARAFDLFEGGQVPDYIVCTDEVRCAAAKTAFTFAGSLPTPSFVTVCTRRAMSPSGVALYELDYKRLAHNIVKNLLHSSDKAAPLHLQNFGFKYQVPDATFAGQTLRFLTVASPASTALSRLLPHFESLTGIHVELTVIGLSDLYDVVNAMGTSPRYDLIRMDMAWISELAPRIYAPLDTIPFDWDSLLSKLLPVFLEDYTSTCGVRCCLPYDPSTQLLFYRRDLFEDVTIRRMYYEMYHRELEVPRDFASFNRVAQFFTQSYHAHSPTRYGTTAAIGNAMVSPSEYLPRLFGEGGSIFGSNGRIALETAEARRALKSYTESFRYSDMTVHEWWRDMLESFANGSVAMTIVFMNYASDMIHSKHSKIAGKIGFAAVPGGKPLLGGGVVGISCHSEKKDAACRFLQWLYSDEVSTAFTVLGGLSPCRAVYSSRDVLELYPWLSTAKRSFASGQRRLSNNRYLNFSEKAFEELISVQVKNAVTGIVSPEDALRYAQKNCERHFILA